MSGRSRAWILAAGAIGFGAAAEIQGCGGLALDDFGEGGTESESGAGAGGHAGSTAGTAGTGGTVGTGGTGGSAGSGASPKATCRLVDAARYFSSPPRGEPLVADPSGLVDVPGLGISGSWYVYRDAMGNLAGPPAPCGTTGTSPCSSITFPPLCPTGGGPCAYPQGPTGTGPAQEFCIDGTAAPNPEIYSDIWGIGIGFDFNDVGGKPMPYNVYTNGGQPRVAGIQFTISGVPSGGIRAEFPENPREFNPLNPIAIAVPLDGTYTVLFNRPGPTQLVPSFPCPSEPCNSPWATFSASYPVLSVQFHVPSNGNIAPVPVKNLCVSDVCMIVPD